MNINWYPGHMKKTRESIEKNLTMVDVVFELLDARIPVSSQNPIIDSLLKNKPRIVLLNKADLASSASNQLWVKYFKDRGIPAILVDALSGKGVQNILQEVNTKTEQRKKAYKKRGVISRPTKAMIIGIPNVGKSTLINTLSGRKGTKTGNIPGITKSNQWIKVKGELELLDTPGILWPKFEDKKTGLNLAFIGSIKDEILDTETLALRLIERLMDIEPKVLENRYNITTNNKTSLQTMVEIGQKRGCIIKGGEIDYFKTANIILDEFRKGIIGKITLELPGEYIDEK